MMTNNSENNEAKQNKNRKRLLITVASAVCVLVIAAVLMTQVIMPNNKYNEAVNLLESGEYLQAIDLFTELGDHKDSKTKIRECEYQMAISMMENGHYEEAISVFQNLKGYKDSFDKINECKIEPAYVKAVELMESEKYNEAIEAFTAIREIRDCSAEIIQCYKKSLSGFRSGESFYFGAYEQDCNEKNGTEAIEWIVIKNDGSKIVAISKYGLDGRPVPKTDNWENSELQDWLSSNFLSRSFAEEELALLVEDKYGDLISIPSVSQLISLCNVDNYRDIDWDIRVCELTEYAQSQGAVGFLYKYTCLWWIMSESGELGYASDEGGLNIGDSGKDWWSRCAVRPIIVIDLSLE